MDCRQVVEHESVVPYVCFPDLVPNAKLPPTPVDVDKVPEGLKSTVVIKLPRRAELLVRQAGGNGQDSVIRPRVIPDEGEQLVGFHRFILRIDCGNVTTAIGVQLLGAVPHASSSTERHGHQGGLEVIGSGAFTFTASDADRTGAFCD